MAFGGVQGEASDDHEEVTKMTKQQDVDAKTCGICSEPFKDGEIAVQATQYEMWKGQLILGEQIRAVLGAPGLPICRRQGTRSGTFRKTEIKIGRAIHRRRNERPSN
jgi:hypothetical protein